MRVEMVEEITSDDECPRWRNQYIDKLNHFPKQVVNVEREEDAAGAQQALIAMSSAYPRLFAEFGSGSGRHLIEQAQGNPDALFVGVELRYKRAYRTVEKGAERGVNNLFMLRSDVALLPSLIPMGSLDGIFVNFPDPWEKRRWRKNRMIRQPFLELIVKLLKPNGAFSFKTDHREYFESSLRLIKESSLFQITKETHDLAASAWENENIRTEFEMLFRSQGRPIHFLAANNKVSVNTF